MTSWTGIVVMGGGGNSHEKKVTVVIRPYHLGVKIRDRGLRVSLVNHRSVTLVPFTVLRGKNVLF